MADSQRETVVPALLRCFDDFQALVGELDAPEWGVQSLCPDWNVRGVVVHLVGIEDVLLGWMPDGEATPPPFEKLGPFMTDVKDTSVDQLTQRATTTLAARREELAKLTDDQFATPSVTPVGPGTYGSFMTIRVFDFWVHQRDMTIPLGRTTDDSGPAAQIALDEVHKSLGYIVGKKAGLPDGKSVAFHLTGGLDRDMFVNVDGRAAVVDSLDSPDVEITADSTTFIMLACGRIDPQEQIDAGKISWTGDSEWGEAVARNLRFTM